MTEFLYVRVEDDELDLSYFSVLFLFLFLFIFLFWI